jgi:hypothetical protein
MIAEPTTNVTLINPWSHAQVRDVSWPDVQDWAEDHVHPGQLLDWLEDARRAFDADDGDTLGRMIIGS